MIVLLILTTSLEHFYLKGWENVRFELGGERVNAVNLSEAGVTRKEREPSVFVYCSNILDRALNQVPY